MPISRLCHCVFAPSRCMYSDIQRRSMPWLLHQKSACSTWEGNGGQERKAKHW